MKDITLLYDDSMTEVVEKEIVPLFGENLKKKKPYNNELEITLGEDGLLVTYLSDELLKEFLPIVISKDWKLGLLPHPGMIHARQGFGVSSSMEEAVTNILNTESVQRVDILMANGRPVFNTVVIGESLSVMYGSAEFSRIKRVWGKTKSYLHLFRTIRLKQYIIEYKEKEGEDKETINTAALGMVIVQHGRSSLLSRRILENSFVNDGMMHNLVLAPESVTGLLKFAFRSFFRSSRDPKLPPFAAHIKTGKIKIKSTQPIDHSIDEVLMSAKEVELEVRRKVIQIVPGLFLETHQQGSTNEIFKVQMLPRGEKRDELLKGPLPFFHHATTDEFKDLFTTLRENSRTKSTYLVLMFLSTFIATHGLFSDSSPVIIGAMILAPLMSPIISLSMGVLRQDSQLIRDSLKTIGFGVLVGYACAIFLTWFTPLNTANVEILSRVRPNLLDLGVAVGSGVAGAYAHSKKEVAQTLAGVAIAVALVPPLAVSGIGVGWTNWTVFSGALLLLVTNFAGMVLAAATTFLFLGFSPFKLARKGLLIALIFVIGVSAPLAFGFTRMVKENRITQKLNGHRIGGIVLREVVVRQTDPLHISVKVVTQRPLSEEELQEIKKEVADFLGEEVELEVTMGLKL